MLAQAAVCLLQALKPTGEWLVCVLQMNGASFPRGPGLVNGQANGSLHADGAAQGSDGDSQLGQQMMDFFTNICVCHSLISEQHPETGEPIFQVPLATNPASLTALKAQSWSAISSR